MKPLGAPHSSCSPSIQLYVFHSMLSTGPDVQRVCRTLHSRLQNWYDWVGVESEQGPEEQIEPPARDCQWVVCRSCGTVFREASGPECVCESGSLWLPPVGGGDTGSEGIARAMLLSCFSELAQYRSVPWTILTHCFAVVWRRLSQVNGGSGRLRTECLLVPIIVGVEVLVLWVPKP